jgi:hypothetical protein
MVCASLIEKDEVGYELEFAQANGLTRIQELHAHARCFAAWELERTRTQP